MKNNSFSLLSGNMLKIIAAISMFIDHLGFIFFPSVNEFRIIGRLAFPIFAFFIAVGCKYTQNKLRYFLQLAVLGTVFQIVFYIFTKETRLNIFITFTLSMLLILPFQNLKFLYLKKKGIAKMLLCGLIFISALCFVYFVTHLFTVDYSFAGCLCGFFASLFMLPKDCEETALSKLDKLPVHLFTFALGLVYLSYCSYTLQYYCLFALPFLALYSGKRGNLNIKYFFYIFYPAHLVLLYGIFTLIYN